MDFQNTIFSLAALFEFIFIMYLVFRLILKKKPVSNAVPDFYNVAPFEVAFAVNGKLRVTSYEEIVPHFWIGFENNLDALIEISQSPVDVTEADGAGRKFAVSVSLEDIKSCGWVTLERSTKALSKLGEYKVKVTVRAKSQNPSTLSAEICIPRMNEQDRRIVLDKIDLTSEYNSFTISTVLKDDALSNVDQSTNSRVILFLPPISGTVIDLLQFSIEFN